MDANWDYFYYQFSLDHARSDLIWNYKTREELKETIDNELRAFDADRVRDLAPSPAGSVHPRSFAGPGEGVQYLFLGCLALRSNPRPRRPRGAGCAREANHCLEPRRV